MKPKKKRTLADFWRKTWDDIIAARIAVWRAEDAAAATAAKINL